LVLNNEATSMTRRRHDSNKAVYMYYS
jgi:hypothetical protein